MSVTQELVNLYTNVADCYDAIEAGGGTLPANKNLENMPTAIGTVGQGGDNPPEPQQPEDPDDVYNETRPSDWLKMPSPLSEELYYLIDIEDLAIDITTAAHFTVTATETGTVKLEIGLSDDNGVFSPISQYTVEQEITTTQTNITSGTFDILSIPVVPNKRRQFLIKLSASVPFSTIVESTSDATFIHSVVEVNGKSDALHNIPIRVNNNGMINLQYFTLDAPITDNLDFYYCQKLITIKLPNQEHVYKVPTSSGSSGFFYVDSLRAVSPVKLSSTALYFHEAGSLRALPNFIYTNGLTTLSFFMNNSESKLTYLGDNVDLSTIRNITLRYTQLGNIDIDSTATGSMSVALYGNKYIKSVKINAPNCSTLAITVSADSSHPQYQVLEEIDIDATKVNLGSLNYQTKLKEAHFSNLHITDSQCFQRCTVLESIDVDDEQIYLDSANSGSSTFAFCTKLKSLPKIINSRSTTLVNFVSHCYELESLPTITNTSIVTNWQQFAYLCRKITSIPTYDYSSATRVDYIYSGCTSLETVGNLDWSNVTGTCNQALAGCTSLRQVGTINVSTTTDISQMFLNCSKLENQPTLITTSGKIIKVMQLFSNCTYLRSLDLSNIYLNATISATNLNSVYGTRYQCPDGFTLTLGDTFGSNSLPQGFVTMPNGMVKITKTDAILPLATRATNVFSGAIAYYVPDDLVEDYKANTNWAYASSMIHPLSEFPEES